MKKIVLILVFYISICVPVLANEENQIHEVHHVVIVWLKQHGDETVKQQYISASQSLVNLSGVLSYSIGSPATINRSRPNPAVDESYDLAINSRFTSKQAYEEFLKNPEYLKIAQELLKPLVDKYIVYDFMD